MIASAAARQPPAAPCSASPASTLVILLGGQRLADHAGRGQEDFLRPAADDGGGRFGDLRARPPCPALPVKALALPLLTTSARASPRLELGPAPIDRRRGGLGLGEDARDLGAGRQHGQQHVGAVLVADPGRAGGQPHARPGAAAWERFWAPGARPAWPAVFGRLAALCLWPSLAMLPPQSARGYVWKIARFDKRVARSYVSARGRHADLAVSYVAQHVLAARFQAGCTRISCWVSAASPNAFRLGQRPQDQAAHGRASPRSTPWSRASQAMIGRRAARP